MRTMTNLFFSCVWGYLFLAMFLSPRVGFAEKENYLDLSLEELMNIEFTSLSKKSESLSSSAAAVYLLNSEDIRRSAANSIPELLRQVPGLHVARINGNQWAISARGFNNPFANKLLVLIDGRSVYTPIFSGVFWESLNLVLDDIERIEVIRGPGGTLWGSNAVNGVINIITKEASETKGTLLSGWTGNIEQAGGQVRFGAELSDSTDLRLYSKYSHRDRFDSAEMSGPAHDASESYLWGFRSDSSTESDSLTFEGQVAKSNFEQRNFRSDPEFPMGRTRDFFEQDLHFHLLSRWQHRFSSDSDTEVTFYVDRTERDYVGANSKLHIVNLEAQHRYQVNSWFELVYGGGYRGIFDEFEGSTLFPLTFQDKKDSTSIINAFLHGETRLSSTVRLITGAKYEYNTFTWSEFQPNVRVSYTPSDDHTWWAGISRAVRLPSRIDDNLIFDTGFSETDSATGLPINLTAFGNPNQEAEDLLSYEVGYRGLLDESLSVDASFFFNQYSDLQSFELASSPTFTSTPIPHIATSTIFDNNLDARSWGAEVAVAWDIARWLRLRTSYSYFDLDFDFDKGARASSPIFLEEDDPRNQVKVHTAFDLLEQLTLDVFYYYVDRLQSLNVDPFHRFDSRLNVNIQPGVDVSIIVENILDEGQQEYRVINGVGNVASEVPRSVWGKIDISF